MADIPNTSPVDMVRRVPGAVKRLPPWVILAVFGAAVVVGLYWYRHSQDRKAAEVQAESSSEQYDVNQGSYDPTALTPDLSAYYGGAGGGIGGFPIGFGGFGGELGNIPINLPSLPSAQGAPTPGEPGQSEKQPITINIGSGLTGGGPPATPEPTHLRASETRAATPTLTDRIHAAINTTHESKARKSGTVKSRTRIEQLAQEHPDWGPHTLAHGGKLRGHSTRF